MSEEQRLLEILETNFKLSILHTRQVADRIGQRMQQMGEEMREDIHGLADRQAETLDVLRKMGDSSVDLRKEVLELKRRVGELEDRAS